MFTIMAISSDDLSKLLEKAGASLTVSVLLQCLQHALEFEAFVSKKYSQPVSSHLEQTTVSEPNNVIISLSNCCNRQT